MLFIALVIFWYINLNTGSVFIPFKAVINILLGHAENQNWETIIKAYRIPKSITAILVGSALGAAGLLMQTFFRNPLAGPYVLGLNSGASLGVALCVLGASTFSNLKFLLLEKWSYAIAASLGSFLVLICVLSITKRVKDNMAILIIGIMFSSVVSAFVSVLSFFASAEALQQYIFWGFGSLGNLSWEELYWFLALFGVGILLSIFSLKGLNSLLLGEAYSKSLGQNIFKNRIIIICATSLLCGTVTAFSGPIAFIGLAIPHLTRQLFKTSDHKILLPATLLLGAIAMLICDSFAQLPNYAIVLPINAITSIIGAPIVIFIIFKNKKLLF